MAEFPIDKIKAMRQQGMDNNQIMTALQKDGFTSTQIFEAMNQLNQQPISPISPPPPPIPGLQTPISNQTQNINPQGTSQSTEELVEAVIDEKWNELVKDITTIIEWKNQAQTTITNLGQQFTDLKDQFDKLHKALIAKIGDYDKNILDVGAEVKAMEKVFSKVLPVFTENVSELSTITKNLKKETGK